MEYHHAAGSLRYRTIYTIQKNDGHVPHELYGRNQSTTSKIIKTYPSKLKRKSKLMRWRDAFFVFKTYLPIIQSLNVQIKHALRS